MTDDAIQRARLALSDSPRNLPTITTRPDQASIKAVLARAAVLLQAQQPSPNLQAHTPTPPSEQTRVCLNAACSSTGERFFLIAEEEAGKMRIVGHERLEQLGEARSSGSVINGPYDFDIPKDWRCPVCLNDESGQYIWSCHCQPHFGTLHCAGSGRNTCYCACGKFEERAFVETKELLVTGQALARANAVRLTGPKPEYPAARIVRK